MSIQRPPFWHRSEISMPGKTERQGGMQLSALGGCLAPFRPPPTQCSIRDSEGEILVPLGCVGSLQGCFDPGRTEWLQVRHGPSGCIKLELLILNVIAKWSNVGLSWVLNCRIN